MLSELMLVMTWCTITIQVAWSYAVGAAQYLAASDHRLPCGSRCVNRYL